MAFAKCDDGYIFHLLTHICNRWICDNLGLTSHSLQCVHVGIRTP
jgi:hypothetical protein